MDTPDQNYADIGITSNTIRTSVDRAPRREPIWLPTQRSGVKFKRPFRPSGRWRRLSQLVGDLGMPVEDLDQLARRAARLDEAALVFVEGVLAHFEQRAGFA